MAFHAWGINSLLGCVYQADRFHDSASRTRFTSTRIQHTTNPSDSVVRYHGMTLFLKSHSHQPHVDSNPGLEYWRVKEASTMTSVSNDEQEYRRPSFPELGAAPPLGGMGSPRFGNSRPMAGIFQGGYFHAWVVNAAPGCHSTRCVYVYMRIAVQYVSCHTVCHCYCMWQPLSSDTQTRSRPNPLPPVCPTHCCSHTAVATQLHVRSTCTSQTRSIWVRRRGVRVTNRWRLPI